MVSGFRCPNCDTLLGDIDMQDWWKYRKFKKYVCPTCGWTDDENMKHSKQRLVLRKIGGDDVL